MLKVSGNFNNYVSGAVHAAHYLAGESHLIESINMICKMQYIVL
jgi:hypothetical protein